MDMVLDKGEGVIPIVTHSLTDALRVQSRFSRFIRKRVTVPDAVHGALEVAPLLSINNNSDRRRLCGSPSPWERAGASEPTRSPLAGGANMMMAMPQRQTATPSQSHGEMMIHDPEPETATETIHPTSQQDGAPRQRGARSVARQTTPGSRQREATAISGLLFSTINMEEQPTILATAVAREERQRFISHRQMVPFPVVSGL